MGVQPCHPWRCRACAARSQCHGPACGAHGLRATAWKLCSALNDCPVNPIICHITPDLSDAKLNQKNVPLTQITHLLSPAACSSHRLLGLATMDLQDHPELRSTALRLGKRGELPVISRGLLITLDYTNSGTTRFGTTNPGDGHQRVTVGFGARRYRPVNDDLIRKDGS